MLPPVIRNAIKSGPVPVLRPIEDICADPQTVGEQVIAFAALHLIVPTGMKRGQPLILDPYQQAFILAVVDHETYTGRLCREAILSIACRNGKTFLISVILLAYLIGPLAEPYTEIASGAMSRDQAALCFKIMKQILQVSPDCESLFYVTESAKKIDGIRAKTEYRALSAEADTGYGADYKVILLDEAGRVKGPNSPFTDMLETRQGSHDDGLFLTVSTQAATDLDYLSLKIDAAIREDDKDSETVCHVYTPDIPKGKTINDIDLMDESAWYAANPGLGKFRSLSDLRKNMKQAKLIPEKEGHARNQYLNLRTSATSLAISATLWKQAAADFDVDVFRRNKVVAGADLSMKTDLTAIVLACEENDLVYIWPLVFCPSHNIEARARKDKAPYDLWVKKGHLIPIGGETMNYDQIAHETQKILTDNEISLSEMHYDKQYMQNFRDACTRENALQGIDWIDVSQGFEQMGARLKSFQEMLISGRLRHNKNPVLTMSTSVAIAKEGRNKISALAKNLSTHRIDPLVAAVMATWIYGDGRGAEQPIDVRAMVG